MRSTKAGTAAASKTAESTVFWHGVLIWLLTALFYFFDNLLNVAPGGMKPQLSQAFNLSAGELGILSSCYLWSYGIMQIPAGLLMDTVGPRRILTVASLICAFDTMLLGLADTIHMACAGRFFIGFGASFAVVGCSKVASVWFSPRRFALFMGLMVAVGMLGAAFGLAAVDHVIRTFGWQQSLFGGALVSVLLSMLLWLIVRDNPPIVVNPIDDSPDTRNVPIFTGLIEVLTCPQAWLAAIYAGLMFVPTLAFGGLWGTPYLVEAHGFSQQDAGQLSALVFVGWVFGGPIYGWVSDYIGRRNPPMYFANITTLIVSIWLIYSSNYSYTSLAIGMFLLGFFSSGFLIAFVITRENNRPEVSATAIGFINTLNTFSVAIMQWLIGWILDLVASDVIITQTGKEFSLAAYQKALMSIPICLVISFIVLLKIKETYCIVKHQG